MSRIEKKCLIASVVLHGLLVAVIVFGAAFKGKPDPVTHHRVNVVPTRLIESALAGGGGDPKLPRTDDRVKGNTLNPVPPVQQTPPAAKRPEPERPQPRAETPEPRDTKPVRPAEPVKPNTSTKTPVTPPKLDLVPTVRGPDKAAKDKAEAQAREAARQEAAARREFAARVGQATANLKAGFEGGTKVQVWGTGGEAHSDYGSLLANVFQDYMRGVTEFSDQDFVIVVEVTVSRSGRVAQSRIVQRAGNATMDRAAQRALDKLKTNWFRELPASLQDSEQKFIIECDLKARRATG